MAFLLSRPSRKEALGESRRARVWTAALRHALPRAQAVRLHTSLEPTMGRRRKLTDEQVHAILEWHRTHLTRAELAQELGIAKHLIGSAIRRRGQYKGPSPENREQNLRERRARIAYLNLRLIR